VHFEKEMNLHGVTGRQECVKNLEKDKQLDLEMLDVEM